LDTNDWAALDIPGTNDITGIQLKSPFGSISIFNIYNDCTHSRNEAKLQAYIQDNTNLILATDNHHMIWAGDFNRTRSGTGMKTTTSSPNKPTGLQRD
jgi:endonuclease/exonuclease/phosphatase family metal-dependent hydrolase